MRTVSKAISLALLLVATPARGQTPPTPAEAADEVAQQVEQTRRATLVAAAKVEAVDRLMEQIEQEPLTWGLSVGQYLDRLNGAIDADPREVLQKELMQLPAIEVGQNQSGLSARVELRLNGVELGRLLQLLSNLAGEARPISPERLQMAAARWNGRSFIATGVSMSPDLLERAFLDSPLANFLPSGGFELDATKRQAAIQQARLDAVDRVLASAGPVILIAPAPGGNGDSPVTGSPLTLAEVLKSPAGEAVRRWLSEQPITRLRMQDDGRLQIKLANVPSTRWRQELRRLVEASQPQSAVPLSDEEWDELTNRLMKELPQELVGFSASLAGESAKLPDVTAMRVQLPTDRPSWSQEPIVAMGEAFIDGSAIGGAAEARERLLALQQARRDALDNLINRIDALPMAGETTLANLASSNPAAGAAIRKVIDNATATSPVWTGNDVHVTVRVDGRALWQELAGKSDE